jgi:hypothetical protein
VSASEWPSNAPYEPCVQNDPAASRTKAAQRTARYRQRQRRGLEVFAFEADPQRIELLLDKVGVLQAMEGETQRNKLGNGVQKLISNMLNLVDPPNRM